MKYTELGTSGIEVSRICLGCMGFGQTVGNNGDWGLSEEDSRAIIKQALDAGITFFDTAMSYHAGESERIVGHALADMAPRDKVVVATKFSAATDEELAQGVTGQQHVENCLNASLERLGLDYVDLYICHMWDYRMPMTEILEGMAAAVKAGKVRALGISNCHPYQLAKANAFMDAHGYPRIVSIQSHYNLIAREDERELAQLCAEDNIAMTPYSALASGRLAHKPGTVTRRSQEDGYARFKYDATEAEDAKIIDRVMEVAEKRGVSMTEVSLAWLLTKVTAPVVGATKPHHIDGAVKATELELTPEEIAYLEEPYVPHALVGVMAQNKPGSGQFTGAVK